MLAALGENLITLLSFDDERCKIIRNTVDVSLYGGLNKIIAARIYDYIDRYKKPPKEHLADILDDKLNSENKREAQLYADILNSIYAVKDTINSEYVMGQLGTYVHRQALRSIAAELGKALTRDTEQSLAEADALIKKAQRKQLDVFNPGLRLSNKEQALEFLDVTSDSFPTGIAELDRRGFGPTRKELWLFVANTKGGKTWALIHLAKMALLSRLKVCHITLEMSEKRAAQRYFQAFFSIAKRAEKFRTTHIQKDELNRISGFEDVLITPPLTFDDPKIRKKLGGKIDKAADRYLDNIIVKQFPTGSLTVHQLVAYLDNLEATERFVPDLLVLDYPDLMKVDKANYRLSLDEIYKDVRGIGVERNIAVAAVSQSHRGAAKAKLVGAENVAEAYSKIAHADTVVTYSQTSAEHALGLARLHVAAGRNDADNLTLVISQSYDVGKFVIDATPLIGNYWGLIPKPEGDESE